jgi:hypothetical protein
MSNLERITVIDVMKKLGVEITNELSWSVGADVRALWEESRGREPDKELRAKTSGAGSHCFAVYPVSFASTIEGVIKAHKADAARQMSLFKT